MHAGPAAGAYLVLGVATGSTGLMYFLFAIVGCIVAAAGLQCTLVQVKGGQLDMIETQIVQVRQY